MRRVIWIAVGCLVLLGLSIGLGCDSVPRPTGTFAPPTGVPPSVLSPPSIPQPH
jgi:hypothetical protein